MKTLIISDIHSNEPAMSAVAAHARRKGASRILCMGDFVGYGAQPNQVLDTIRAMKGRKFFIRGNHDRVAAGVEDGEGFNQAARHAALWTRGQLSHANLSFLKKLPVGPLPTEDGVLVCHGSPFDEDEYIFSEYDAHNIFNKHSNWMILFGHTHLPSFFVLDEKGNVSGWLVREPTTFRLEKTKRYLINPGSVGQPRDRVTLAAYAIFDQERSTIQYLRVEYDIARAQRAILDAGLPRILADRLTVGA